MLPGLKLVTAAVQLQLLKMADQELMLKEELNFKITNSTADKCSILTNQKINKNIFST